MEPQILKEKKGIIFGALDEKSIAWAVALKAKAAGAEIILSNAPIALRFGKIHELAALCNAEVIVADATSEEDLTHLFQAATQKFSGKIDFVLHAIGMSMNVRKKKHYTELNYDFFQKTLDISALSFHKMLQVAMKLDAIKSWGSVVALSYIAAQRSFPGYNDMAEAKALLEAIGRNFGYHYGIKNKIRINTVSQSPTYTTAGSGVEGFDAFYNYAEQMSPLGNAPAQACADFCIALFSDLCKYVTMQNIFHDGGFSNVGVSDRVMETFTKK